MKNKGFSTVGIVVVIVIVAILCVATFAIINSKSNSDYAQYDSGVIVEADETNGQIADHVKGDAGAPVAMVEYINYGCSHCASSVSLVNDIIEKANGNLAVVVRVLPNSGFPNSKAAASAAEAAGLQGFWQEYSEKLLANQAEWSYAESDERTGLFVKYFEEITNGTGNIDQFKNDMNSDAVAAKLKFDQEMGDKDEVTGTPMFYIEGQKFDANNGGELKIGEETITYGPLATTDDYIKVINDIAVAKNGMIEANSEVIEAGSGEANQ